jgi:hypothetical protein
MSLAASRAKASNLISTNIYTIFIQWCKAKYRALISYSSGWCINASAQAGSRFLVGLALGNIIYYTRFLADSKGQPAVAICDFVLGEFIWRRVACCGVLEHRRTGTPGQKRGNTGYGTDGINTFPVM